VNLRGTSRASFKKYLFFLGCSAFLLAALAMPTFRTRAANPTSGTIGPAGPPVTWVGTATGTGAQGGEGQCIDALNNCDTFRLTVTGTDSDWAGKLAQVKISWSVAVDDYDLFVHKCPSNSSTDAECNDAPVAAQGANQGAPGTEEVAFLDVRASGVGDYTVHVDYGTNPIPNTDQYHGTVSLVPGLGPAPQGAG